MSGHLFTAYHWFTTGLAILCAVGTSERVKRNGGSRTVGQPCNYNTDCMQGMYCNAGICVCYSNWVQYNQYCYQKFDPGQNGCQYNVQCSAVWPGASCDSGRCRCPTDVPTPVKTPEGFVCVREDANTATTGRCPLPFRDDIDAALKDASGTAITCTVGQECEVGLTKVGHMYDCIPKGSGTEGICCPNRATTCMLPLKTDGGSNIRYYFSPESGSCRQFGYTRPTAGANANNFLTKEQCESYCLTACPRGTPLFVQRITGQFSSREVQTCAGGCSNTDYECKTIGSDSRCCLTTNAICSAAQQNGVAAPPAMQSSRFYYDTNQRKCTGFTWTGQGGNFNNFDNEGSCTSFCGSMLCERGDPLRDTSGNKQCSSNAQCPSTHACNKGVCCPSKQSVCTMDSSPGSCSQPSQRYWYNSVTRDCQLFDYSGCQGNANNFKTLTDCQNYCRGIGPTPTCPQGIAYVDAGSGGYLQCSLTSSIGSRRCPANYECIYDGQNYACCPSKAYTCSITMSPGVSCGPRSARWYYETSSQTCQVFQYEGCDGNSNNFASRDQCERYCGVGGCPFGGMPSRDKNSNQLMLCQIGSNTCPSQHECTTVNGALSYCCPTKAYICQQTPLQGLQCGASADRYYFNAVTKRCQSFTYAGCGSNGNNFATLTECKNFCSTTACAAGEMAYMDPNSPSQPVSCNPGQPTNSCPSGFRCSIDSLTGKGICCGSNDMGVCHPGEIAYVEQETQTARTCLPSNAASCPSGFSCKMGKNQNGYYCCKSASGYVCPIGKAAQRNGNKPVSCNLGSVLNVCESGYSCQSTIQGVFQGFCCSINAVCPDSADLEVYTTSALPRQCTPSAANTGCSKAYTCRSAAGQTTLGNYCCKTPATTSKSGCPEGQNAYMVGGLIQSCNPQIGNSCPSSYTCRYINEIQRHQCCGIGSAATPKNVGCPPGTYAYVDPISLITLSCVLGQSQCPNGYSCQYAQVLGRYQCCSTGGAGGLITTLSVSVSCPSATQTAYLDGGVSRSCNIFAPNCPNGYTCQRILASGNSICCGSPVTRAIAPVVNTAASVCTSGSAYILPGTSSPQDCTNNFFSCPSGYSCSYYSPSRRYYCCSTAVRSSRIDNSVTSNQLACSGSCWFGCPYGSTCQINQGMYQCCKSSSSSYGYKNNMFVDDGISNPTDLSMQLFIVLINLFFFPLCVFRLS